MRLKDLSTYDRVINSRAMISEAAEFFKQIPSLPGVIVAEENVFCGMISRKHLFEALGRPFGIELLFKRTAKEFCDLYPGKPLILEASMLIEDAVKDALARSPEEIYEPIVVHSGQNGYTLLDMQTLLHAQRNELIRLYNEVQKLSVKDPLTDINNRRGFLEAVNPLVQFASKTKKCYSILMIDIDQFKLVNDIYGHLVGDHVIRSVARECARMVRTSDIMGRYGGEEFVIFLPETMVDEAFKIAERIRQNIQNLVTYANGSQVSVTISIGISYMDRADSTLDSLLVRADQALYAAKNSGRNRTIIWDALVACNMRRDIVAGQTGISAEDNDCRQVDEARIYDETIEGWARALELRDRETKGHADRVTYLAVELAREMGFDDLDLVDIRRGALLHDIGKIAIPDHILLKPGALTEEEWAVMRQHPVYAFELLSPITFLQRSIDIPYCHHEHWNGGGYPRGLKGQEIPLSARIFTVVDVWDALTTDRCYRPAWSPEQAKQYLIEESGRLFDPNIVEIFLNMLKEITLSQAPILIQELFGS